MTYPYSLGTVKVKVEAVNDIARVSRVLLMGPDEGNGRSEGCKCCYDIPAIVLSSLSF